MNLMYDKRENGAKKPTEDDIPQPDSPLQGGKIGKKNKIKPREQKLKPPRKPIFGRLLILFIPLLLTLLVVLYLFYFQRGILFKDKTPTNLVLIGCGGMSLSSKEELFFRLKQLQELLDVDDMRGKNNGKKRY